jgi:short-subunit dehydrogenase
MRLDGALGVVTGAGSGIGRALAVALAEGGMQLVLVGRRSEALAETAALLSGAAHYCVTADITTVSGRQAVVGRVADLGNRLTLLVNNAGIVPVGPLAGCDDDIIATTLATNVAAPIALTRALLPALRAGRPARVVNVGSMFGYIAFPQFAVYSASKFAMRGFSDALRRELASDGIGVTLAAPRATRTPAAVRFAHLADTFGMAFDEPERIAARIVQGIRHDWRTVYPVGPERFFLWLQRLLPNAVDRALIRKAERVPAPATPLLPRESR